MVSRIIRISNYLFAAAMPFTHIGGYLAAGIGAFLSAAFWKRVRREPLFLALSAFILYGLARNVFAAERAIGYGTMAGYFSHWMLPFLLGYGLGDLASFKKAYRTWYFVMAGLVAVSVLAYFGLFYPRLGAGFVLTEEGLLKGLRSHISLGALVLLLSFLSLGQALDRENAAKGKRAVFLALTAFFLGALLLTGSRGYYIAAALSYTLLGLTWAARTGNWKYPAAAGTALAGMALLLFFLSP
ncbi:MAG: hypothetical protein ACYC5N_12035, partial [Endomicrobiales bacterium]